MSAATFQDDENTKVFYSDILDEGEAIQIEDNIWLIGTKGGE